MSLTRGYIRTKKTTLTACLKKMQNQYGLISPDTDWDNYNSSGAAEARWLELWPDCMGGSSGIQMVQCQETLDWLFGILLTVEQVARLKDTPSTPIFDFSYEGELDGEGEPLPTPTFKVKIMDDSEPPVWTGDYREQTICRQ